MNEDATRPHGQEAKIMREAEVEYGNVFGEEVAWRFLGVAALQLLQIDDLELGASLLSRSFNSLERYRDLFEIEELPEGQGG
ncbi:hypothetical protein AB0L05_15805 [Nonomuraea pusilla]|uniref:hypothetical protein n=1 Tax=Nonomuraea pusilla TaxID=46177 RepID=UPI003322993E